MTDRIKDDEQSVRSITGESSKTERLIGGENQTNNP